MASGLGDSNNKTVIEAGLVTVACLALFLPFLSLQYDTNGLVEASAVEAGNLLHKNHLLYRIVAYVAYRGLLNAGYAGKAIVVLQWINAVCGALGVGFAYITYKLTANSTVAAIAGTTLVACSFIYWLFSTDATYVTLAAMFASASVAVLLAAHSPVHTIAAGLLTALAILTWQASVFLIPALIMVCLYCRADLGHQTRARYTLLYTATACLVAGLAYVCLAFWQHGIMGVSALARWLTSYGETGTLPMWGKWDEGRTVIALRSALSSILPLPLAVPLTEIRWGIQRGRIAVDVALLGFGFLGLLAGLKTQAKAICFLLGYAIFLPFIIWWDPFEPKWFLVPNLFLAAFFSTSLVPWFQNRYVSVAITGILLCVAATNFITTIRPRHNDIGPFRHMAQCVAENLRPNDLFLAAEWGWPDYLEYLHHRRSLSLISNSSSLREALDEVQRDGGQAFTLDPNEFSDAHISWLKSQSGIDRNDLRRLAVTPAFLCYGRTIFAVPTSP
ncbi:MAG: hypothetical protein DMG16_17245 [Acidobacteria bacterium]|nr:MAG: hypothetical protein DMG16_17245 [Acidobacteriota bacterium]